MGCWFTVFSTESTDLGLSTIIDYFTQGLQSQKKMGNAHIVREKKKCGESLVEVFGAILDVLLKSFVVWTLLTSKGLLRNMFFWVSHANI